MEINGHNPSHPRATGDSRTSGATSREPAARQANGRAPGLDDKVSLTDTATLIQRLSQRIAESPEVDQSRVEAIRQSLAAGSYRIDPERVAEKMIALESALAGDD